MRDNCFLSYNNKNTKILNGRKRAREENKLCCCYICQKGENVNRKLPRQRNKERKMDRDRQGEVKR